MASGGQAEAALIRGGTRDPRPALAIVSQEPAPGAPARTISTKQAAILQSSLARLPASSLAELCQRLRVQLVQQRLPLVCAECRPSLVRLHQRGMELNLTQMLRGLCARCRTLFMASQAAGLDRSKAADSKTISAAAAKGPSRLPRSTIRPAETAAPEMGGGAGEPMPPAAAKGGASGITKIILRVGPTTSGALARPPSSVFEAMTVARASWCRYCGTGASVRWRPGPWGQRTLCDKHGAAYAGRPGAALRLDLSPFQGEKLADRRRPILQDICSVCQRTDREDATQRIWPCAGCPKGYHRKCIPPKVSSAISPITEEREMMTTTLSETDQPWFCSPACAANLAKYHQSPARPPASPSQARKRALSEPAPLRRFAKQFDNIIATPPTPPPTPKRGGKRRRTTVADITSDVMICFDPDATIIKRPAPKKPLVFTPAYQAVAFPPLPPAAMATATSAPSDTELLSVHGRYEKVEKNVRLCHPDVLRSLATPPPPPSSGLASEAPALLLPSPEPSARPPLEQHQFPGASANGERRRDPRSAPVAAAPLCLPTSCAAQARRLEGASQRATGRALAATSGSSALSPAAALNQRADSGSRRRSGDSRSGSASGCRLI